MLHFVAPPGFILDLRSPVDAASQRVLKAMGFERSFGVITAQNPMGANQSSDANAALAASLRMNVARLSVPKLEVDACSPDRAHCERSVAIALDLAALVDLGYRYDQLAIFWYDGRSFWIVPAHATLAKLRLPRRR